jgi:hypothetical protein
VSQSALHRARVSVHVLVGCETYYGLPAPGYTPQLGDRKCMSCQHAAAFIVYSCRECTLYNRVCQIVHCLPARGDEPVGRQTVHVVFRVCQIVHCLPARGDEPVGRQTVHVVYRVCQIVHCLAALALSLYGVNKK